MTVAPRPGESRRADMMIATGLGIGCVRVAPGSFGSLAALPLAWILHMAGGATAILAAAAVCFAAGCWAAGRVVARNGVEDPGYIVIDEIAAQLLVLAVLPQSVAAYAVGFVAFRIADVVKPFPADWCDRNIHGGLGVMLDDAVAGVQAAAVAWLVCRYLPI
jgi:phosphatidylglycerophosphatase A